MESFDQYRREVRRELFMKRQQDHDHSELRLFNDARELDSRLLSAGYDLAYTSEWTRRRDLSSLEADISDLNLKDISEVENG